MTWLEYHREPVELHSGDRSHWLVNADAIYEDIETRKAVLDKWASFLGYIAGYREFIGVTRGGALWAQAIATRMMGKCHKMSVPELTCYGHLLEATGERHPLVVVDDVTTTGKTFDLVPRADEYLVVVDRRLSIPDGNKIRAWAHIPLPLVEG